MAYWRPAEIAPVVFLANANMAAIALEMITFLKAVFQVNRKTPKEHRVVKWAEKKPTAQAKRMRQFTADILAATISGLIVLAVQKMLNW